MNNPDKKRESLLWYNDKTVMKAIAIWDKPYLKAEEAMIYCNLGRTLLVSPIFL
jgi:hypothetical protein